MYIRKILLFVLIFTFSFGLPVLADQGPPVPSDAGDFRGVWVATAANTDYPLKPTTSAEALKQEAVRVLDTVQSLGLNAVFLQVRPAADALYPSEYFPWSRFLTGTEGAAPDQGFDPLAFWIEEAHKRGLELHAWITPFRVTKKAYEAPAQDFSSLTPSNPAFLHQDWVVKHPDGNLYFDPGIPGVRSFLVDSTMEVVLKYNVDGIHFDGFFYPDRVFADQTNYDQYKNGNESLDDWRRSNVTAFLREVHQAMKDSGKNQRLGVSPFGIWANQPGNPLGSATSGQESYHQQYADSLKWIQEGVIDYIVPQVFWNIGYPAADYQKLVLWWKNAVSNSKVDLYIGHAAYKAGSSDSKNPWYSTAEIEKQLKLNESQAIMGSVFSSYASLSANTALSQAIRSIYQLRDNPDTALPVSFSRPLENLRTYYTRFYLNGASDPTQPLYLNGQPVKNRSIQGYFGVLVPLSYGDNVFTITQGNYSDTRAIHRIQSEPAKPLSTADIPEASAYPQAQEFRAPGEKLTLSCKAPIGSSVTVTVNGKKYKMTPATASKTTSLYTTTYSCTYTLPGYTGTPRVVDLGAPVYTMTYKKTTKTRKAPASIGVIMAGAPYYAEVKKDATYTYRTPDTDGGGYHELHAGMVDSVTGLTGGFARLSNGQYILKSTVKLISELKSKPVIESAEYVPGERWDILRVKTTALPAAYITSDSKALKIQVSAASKAGAPALPEKSLFSAAAAETKSPYTTYTLTLKDSRKLEGFIVERTEQGLAIHLKHRVYAASGEKPLAGITIMVDPGHGGAETGAIGPLGLKYSEKDMNLDNSFWLKAELEAMGAAVLMTRTADVDLSLADRLIASKNARPDMFISIHANAMPDNVDISQYFGFSTYHREAHSRALSQVILDHTLKTLNRKNNGIHQKNFYVVKGTWAPSMLIECGFVPNPVEFEWLIDKTAQQQLMKTIAQGILKYFSE